MFLQRKLLDYLAGNQKLILTRGYRKLLLGIGNLYTIKYNLSIMIKLIKSTFYNEKATKEALCKFIERSDKLSIGKECRKFEESFALYQKRKYCIFVNSGSSANLALIQALLNLGKIKKGDMVGFSSLTWSTNVMPLIQLGLNAIPIDVELDTLNISSKSLLSIIKKYPIKMLFITNLLGFCDD